jgi:hypothetical protein
MTSFLLEFDGGNFQVRKARILVQSSESGCNWVYLRIEPDSVGLAVTSSQKLKAHNILALSMTTKSMCHVITTSFAEA